MMMMMLLWELGSVLMQISPLLLAKDLHMMLLCVFVESCNC